MSEDHETGAAVFASSGKVVALPQADATQDQDHLTWAYQTHVTAIYQYIYSRVGNRPDAEFSNSRGVPMPLQAMMTTSAG